MITVYNLSPAKAAASDILDRNSATNSRKYTGYDINFNGRKNKLTVFGGVSLGRTISNTCQVEDLNSLRFCDLSQFDIPMYTQFKLNGSYMLPWAVQVSGTFQSYPGDARNSTVDSTTFLSNNALNNGTIPAIDPSLRVVWNVDRTTFKNLTGATLTQPSVNVILNEPGSKLLDRQNQLDVRVKRLFHVRNITLEGQVDAYNALNTGVVLTRVQTFGSALDRPASILQGRLIRVGLQARW
jgi:hypothetical protein